MKASKLRGMEILELIGCFVDLLDFAEIGKHLLGFIGWVVGNIFTWGCFGREYDDWQSILTGAITFIVTLVVVIKCCFVSPEHAHSTTCVLAPHCLLA